MIDAQQLKQLFPIFRIHPQLCYLDNAATMQKPEQVIEGIARFYREENANIHRGIYDLAATATQRYEAVREKVAHFLKVKNKNCIVYTSGTTAGINLVAQSFLLPRLQEGDEVMISAMEHHANLIPWQMACEAKGAHLRIIPMNQAGELDIDFVKQHISPKTKMLAFCHISNTLGSINPAAALIELAHQKDIPVLVDIAQSAAHYPINAEALDADFLVFSGHKLYGPTGIGVLYGKYEWLEKMPPIFFGGDMIREVTFEKTSFAAAPQKFEAGTTHIAGVIGLGYAIDFLNTLNKNDIVQYLDTLRQYCEEQMQPIKGLNIIGKAALKSAIVSFTIEGIHPHDIATFLGAENIAVRAGHHCTQPVMDYYGLPATTRASFSIYNTREDIDRMIAVLRETIDFFNG